MYKTIILGTILCVFLTPKICVHAGEFDPLRNPSATIYVKGRPVAAGRSNASAKGKTLKETVELLLNVSFHPVSPMSKNWIQNPNSSEIPVESVIVFCGKNVSVPRLSFEPGGMIQPTHKEMLITSFTTRSSTSFPAEKHQTQFAFGERGSGFQQLYLFKGKMLIAEGITQANLKLENEMFSEFTSHKQSSVQFQLYRIEDLPQACLSIGLNFENGLEGDRTTIKGDLSVVCREVICRVKELELEKSNGLWFLTDQCKQSILTEASGKNLVSDYLGCYFAKTPPIVTLD